MTTILKNRFTYKIKTLVKNHSEDTFTVSLLYEQPKIIDKKRILPCLVEDAKKIPLITRQINEFSNKDDIVVCCGYGLKEIMLYKKGVRILHNPFFNDTGSIEPIKNTLLNTSSSRVLFLTDSFLLSSNKIIEAKRSSESILYYTHKQDFKEQRVSVDLDQETGKYKLGFNKANKYFSGCFMLTKKELELAVQYVGIKYTMHQLYFEIISYILQNHGKFKLEKI